MIALKEEIKDWISKGYDQGAQYMFVLKPRDSTAHRPYWVAQGQNVEVVRTMITEAGEQIVNEVNFNIRLLFLNKVL